MVIKIKQKFLNQNHTTALWIKSMLTSGDYFKVFVLNNDAYEETERIF